jgi:hypothetical protein
MTVLLKDPNAALDYSVDWSAYLEAGETLAGSAWQIDPAGELAYTAASFDAASATATLSGGVIGHVYRVTNRITTSLGRIDDRSFILRVEDQ